MIDFMGTGRGISLPHEGVSDLKREGKVFLTQTVNDVVIEASSFTRNGVNETHLFVKNTGVTCQEQVEQQLIRLLDGVEGFLSSNAVNYDSPVFMRCFVSDFANQAESLHQFRETVAAKFNGCAVSIVQQPPLLDGKVVLQLYLVQTFNLSSQLITEKSALNNGLLVKRGEYRHVWTTMLTGSDDTTDPSASTTDIFVELQETLGGQGCVIKDNCIRTWVYVKDIDYNYHGVVTARKNFFSEIGMTKDTHFIASTGIEGRCDDADVTVMVDAYSLGGISQEQIKFLHAPDYLNPTFEYGVTFERGTSVDFGDRRHIYISGTASINNEGSILHRGDVIRQVERTIVNIVALLEDADATMNDIVHMIVYLRDVSDTVAVETFFSNNYREVPKVLVLAPVCRPGWLIEIECVAIKEIDNEVWRNF